jgi:hypothetical protein
MKHPSFINLRHAVVAAIALAFLPAGHAEDAPRIDALRVAKMAAEYLATRGCAGHAPSRSTLTRRSGCV